MRRQRTSSETAHDLTGDSELENADENIPSDNTDDMSAGEHGTDSINSSEEEGDGMTSEDYNSDYNDYNSDEDEDDMDPSFDIMNQLQSALLGGANLNPETLARLRQNLTQLTAANALFASTPTHSTHIRSIIQALPSPDTTPDPMILYTSFTELWELIVLTGEEVEAYEFDSLVDLKGLVPHLVRVLRWEDDCQVYGSEFLLYAIRCTRACIQYSPASSRRLVDCGVVSVVINQLRSVEYIDLAEDLIQIILLLSAVPNYAKNCLHAEGIEAVLGFVDFLALSVQVNAFSSAAQMASALTDDTFSLHLTPHTLQLVHQTLGRYSEDDQGTLKLVHQSAQIIMNAIHAAPKHSEAICPDSLVISTILPMSTVLPLDSASIVLKLQGVNVASNTLIKDHAPALLSFFQTLLKTAGSNEPLLEIALKIVVELCHASAPQVHIRELVRINLKNYKINNTGVSCDVNGLADLLIDFFYLNSPSMSASSHHSCLLVLLLLDDALPLTSCSLVKIGAISRLLTAANYANDPLSLIIGLEWCRVLSTKSCTEFVTIAIRQGLPLELESLKTHLTTTAPVQIVSEDLRKWLEERLAAFNVTLSGEELELFKVYTKHLVSTILQAVSINEPENTPIVDHTATSNNVQQFLEIITKSSSAFTEFEWLGDPETCLARQLLDLLAAGDETYDPALFEPVVSAIYGAMARYDSFFTLNLPSISRPPISNPLEAIAMFSRPVPVRICIPSESKETMLMCDMAFTFGWWVKLVTCGDAEREGICLEYDSGGVDQVGSIVRIQDALQAQPTLTSAKVVNFSSTAFNHKSVSLKITDKNNCTKTLFPRPSQSLFEVLFADINRGSGDPWKRISELWSNSITLTIEDKECVTLSNNNTAHAPIDARIDLALKLLSKIPFKVTNDNLSSKLSKELSSPLLISVQAISRHWISSAQSHPFLFPFELRVALMKYIYLGSLRGAWILQQQNAHLSIPVPRRKFKVHRGANFLKCLRTVLAPANCGDLRLFEFEYAEELGTGHGPTMEFYALASTEIARPSLGLFHVTRPGNLDADEMVEAEGEGLFPSWTRFCDQEGFRMLGSLVARAWLDDRIIDIPLHPLYVRSLKHADLISLEELKLIDSALYTVLTNGSLIGSGVGFLVPGTEISLTNPERSISTAEDLNEFQRLLVDRINSSLKRARESFLKGFSDSFPHSFEEAVSFFPVPDLLRLFSSSTSADSSEWSISSILSSLIPEHGYRPDSLQIRWLAEIISETANNHFEKVKLIRFLTGAAYLPVGGWKALNPPLTIVCKTFSDSDINASSSVNLNTPSPSISTSSIENHDIYLPSVMTCANYLKLPRYSSKEVMRERLQYAIKEGCGSFHLS